jgi:ankyrin repeat protein
MAHNQRFNNEKYDEKYDPEATQALHRILNENRSLNQKVPAIRRAIRSGADPHLLLEPIRVGIDAGHIPFEKLAVIGQADFLQELFGLGLEPIPKMLGDLIKEFGFAPKNNQLKTICAILDEYPEFANELVDDFYVKGENNHKTTTPLILAVKRGVKEIVESLLEHGANPDLQDANGRTALMYAIEYNRDIVPLLIRYGADTQLQNKRGRRARNYLGAHSNYAHLLKNENNYRTTRRSMGNKNNRSNRNHKSHKHGKNRRRR